MTDTLHALPNAATPPRWPLARIVVLILAATFLGLAADLRLEHVEAVHENKLAWTPIVCSCMTAFLAAIAAWRWTPITRRVALTTFLLAGAVGILGFYLHNRGNLLTAPLTLLHAWTDPTLEHTDGPPQNAPMTFATLGLLGALACHRRFTASSTPSAHGAKFCPRSCRSHCKIPRNASPPT